MGLEEEERRERERWMDDGGDGLMDGRVDNSPRWMVEASVMKLAGVTSLWLSQAQYRRLMHMQDQRDERW